MNSRHSHSLAAWRRSQSQICRWTSGSDTRRRSGRGDRARRRSARTSPRLTLLPLAPDQETVGQHHTDRMAMKTRPQPPLILIPTQEPLGLLMILLHPMPSVGILHQTIHGHLRPEVTPVVSPLAIGGILANQPARFAATRRTEAQARTTTNRPWSQPWLPSRHATVRQDRGGWDPITASAR